MSVGVIGQRAATRRWMKTSTLIAYQHEHKTYKADQAKVSKARWQYEATPLLSGRAATQYERVRRRDYSGRARGG